jgi:hypothetical protein
VSRLKACIIAELAWLPTYRWFPLGSVAMKLGCDDVANGAVLKIVSDPSLPIAYADKLFVPEFAT